MREFLKTVQFCLRNTRYMIRSIPTFLDNVAVCLFNKKAWKGPLFAIWDITDKCDCHCVYCDHWRNPDAYKELETERKLEIVHRLAEAHVGGLSICGGEPLYVDGTDRVIQLAKSRGLFVNLDTNGSMLYEKAEELVEYGLDSIIVSIEAGSFEDHNTVRIHKNLCEKLEKGINKLKEIRRGSKPSIFIRTLIHRKSYKKLDEFVGYWDKKVDQIFFQPIHHSPNNYQKIPPGFNIEKSEEQEFTKIYSDILSKYPALNTVYHRLIPAYFFNFNSIKKKYRCFQGTFLADIDSQGNLFTCTERLTKLGNLFQGPMRALWDSPGARQARKQNTEMTPCYWQANSMMSIYLTRLLGLGIAKKQRV